MAVPVCDWVTGLWGVVEVSAGKIVSCGVDWILKWEQFLLSWPENVSTTYDLGASAAWSTLAEVRSPLVLTQTGWSSGSVLCGVCHNIVFETFYISHLGSWNSWCGTTLVWNDLTPVGHLFWFFSPSAVLLDLVHTRAGVWHNSWREPCKGQ